MLLMNLTTSDVFAVSAAVIGSLGGGAVLVTGLSGWLGRVWADRLMQDNIAKHNRELEEIKSKFEAVNQRLQAELDKTLHVHHLHFETEFKALTDIWAKLSGLRTALAASTPTNIVETTKDQRLELLSPLVSAISDANYTFKRAVDEQSPFYSGKIFQKLQELLLMVAPEVSQLEKDFSQKEDAAVYNWFVFGPTLLEKVCEFADQISALIRARLERLSAYADPKLEKSEGPGRFRSPISGFAFRGESSQASLNPAGIAVPFRTLSRSRRGLVPSKIPRIRSPHLNRDTQEESCCAASEVLDR
jgi:hypothetical protein